MAWLTRLALLRLAAQWRPLLTTTVGVLLATVIGANTALYTDAVSQLGMLDYLDQYPKQDAQISVRTGIAPAEVDDFSAQRDLLNLAFNSEIESHFDTWGAWSPEVVSWAETQSMYVMRGGANGEYIESVRLRLAHYAALQKVGVLVAGDWPSDADLTTEAVPVLLPAVVADELDLRVGDTIGLDQRGWDTSQRFDAVIVGIVRPLAPPDSYWMEPSPLRVDTPPRIELEANVLTTSANLENVAKAFLPQASVQLGWRVLFDHTELPHARIVSAQETLVAFESDLKRTFEEFAILGNSLVYGTSLPALLAEYNTEAGAFNLPIILLSAQLSALVLFFLVLIAALAQRSERREIAVMQARGARNWQLLLVRMVETAIICSLAFVIAPFIARALLTAGLPLLMGIEDFTLTLSVNSFLFAGIAAVVAWITLIITMLPLLSQPLILSGGLTARSVQRTWWQRYYLDVVLLVIGLVALYQINQQQSLDAIEGRADPILLLTPTLLFIAFSSVILRLFPGLVNLIAHFYDQRPGLDGALSAWQVSRESLHYGRIAFLMALAIGIGWFAIAYQSTLVGNRQAQARYAVGADLRFVLDNDSDRGSIATLRSEISDHAEVIGTTDVLRLDLVSVTRGIGRSGRQPGEILGVIPESFSGVAYWRDDYAPVYVPAGVEPLPDTGLELPFVPTRIGLWVLVEGQQVMGFWRSEGLYPQPFDLSEGVRIDARLRDADNQIYQVTFEPQMGILQDFVAEYVFPQPVENTGNLPEDYEPPHIPWPNDGWVYMRAELPASNAESVRLEGLTVVSFGGGNRFRSLQNRITLADLELYNASGQLIESELLGDSAWTLTSWQVAGENVPPPSLPPLYTGDALSVAWQVGDANTSLLSLWLNYPERGTIDQQAFGITVPDEEIVGVPVLASRSLADLNELVQDQRFSLYVDPLSIWFEVRDVIDLYPTAYPETPYLVVDYQVLNYVLQRAAAMSLPTNEIWVRLHPDADSETIIDEIVASAPEGLIEDVQSVAATLETYASDVQSLGIIGLLYISFAVGLVLSAVGLFTYIALSVQARIGEFAVLRALGLPVSRLVWLVVREQILIMGVAILLGIIIGQFLTMQVLPPLALSAAGGRVTPPYIIQLDLMLLIPFFGLLILVLVGILALSAIWMRRAADAQALRFSEE